MSSSRPRALQVLQQTRDGFIERGPEFAMVLGEILVTVPIPARKPVVRAAPDLHKANAALEQPPSNQTASAHIGGVRFIQAVQLRVASDSSRTSSTSGALSCRRAAIS